MSKRKSIIHGFLIDKLTNSIENTVTGEVFNTGIIKLTAADKSQIRKSDWKFKWQAELKDETKEVYKLTTIQNPGILQGLVSVEDKGDHIFMHLLESATFNKGRGKVYLGVPGNLVAFACKLSMNKGYEGFVAFDAKSALIQHYQDTLYATHFRGQRMFIETKAALRLIAYYFKD